ncbi:hypothetical protein SKAU_G00146620 [Synaphobranchus kaupii]|uniref:Uncharacterized protein n=1 Tax=Synaphobranchus kaupii TaxID=118154 RepID=A0A9Q1FT89_SYNKA|nr:hypothetical protein SKAU_G00146620 [Synaphobranchus kaupii]
MAVFPSLIQGRVQRAWASPAVTGVARVRLLPVVRKRRKHAARAGGLVAANDAASLRRSSKRSASHRSSEGYRSRVP